MPILDLNNLCVGDVILEPGMDKIAAMDANEGQGFGHAKLVVCRLAFIHAPGPGEAARVEPFAVKTWRKAGEPAFVGVHLDRAVVLRKRGVVATNVQAEAQWEAGYGYASLAKLQQLELDPKMQELVQSPIARKAFEWKGRRGVPVSDEGRSCGELVAQILLPGESTDITPNGLRQHFQMEERSDLILDDAGWNCQGLLPCNEDLISLFADYKQDTARRLWDELVKLSAKQLDESALKRAIAALETEMDESLKNNLGILLEADGLASEILPN